MSDTDDSTEAMPFSRSTVLPPSMGKATCVIKCSAPDVVKDDFTRLWKSLGYDAESEFLLDMVLVRLYGHEAVLNMRAKKLRMATGTSTESVQNVGSAQP